MDEYPQPTALELVARKGQPDGYAALDGSGKVPVAQMPELSPPGTGVASATFCDRFDRLAPGSVVTHGSLPEVGAPYRISVVGGGDPPIVQSDGALGFRALTYLQHQSFTRDGQYAERSKRLAGIELNGKSEHPAKSFLSVLG